MLTITDGYASDDVTLPSIELRDMGVVMLGIGFGPESQLMRYTLESLSSDPKDQFTFIFGYDRLVESTQQIVKRACEGKTNQKSKVHSVIYTKEMKCKWRYVNELAMDGFLCDEETNQLQDR